jgi:hypothetical protein
VFRGLSRPHPAQRIIAQNKVMVQRRSQMGRQQGDEGVGGNLVNILYEFTSFETDMVIKRRP